MTDVTIWTDVVALGRRIVREFDLYPAPKQVVFEPLSDHPQRRADGFCHDDTNPPKVEIRLHCVGKRRRPLRRSTIMSTLAHELAHFRCPRHDAEHGELTREIAAWLKAHGQTVSRRMHSQMSETLKGGFRRAWKKPKPR